MSLSSSDRATVFADDEVGYLDWVSIHPKGAVLVSTNPPAHNYSIVHRADCHTINPMRRRDIQNWTHHYVKVCAASLVEIQHWADTAWGSGAGLRKCVHCLRAGRI